MLVIFLYEGILHDKCLCSNSKKERKELWIYLTQIGVGIRKPWAILEDFNAALHSEDRLGGNPVTLAEVAEFQEWLDVSELEEMASTGSTYSWNDKGEHSRVYSKLDWVFMNGEWLDEMPRCGANF